MIAKISMDCETPSSIYVPTMCVLPEMETANIRIAITGGGLAGAAVANALVQLSGFEIHVFESASLFSERGAAVGISAKAQLALEQLVHSAPELLHNAGGTTSKSSHILIVSNNYINIKNLLLIYIPI